MPRHRFRPRWGFLAAILIVGAAAWLGWREYQRLLRDDPQSLPWTELRLTDPIGRFTATKLVALGDEPARCRALLAGVGDNDQPAPSISTGDGQCGFTDGMRLVPEGPGAIGFTPAVITACPVAAALKLWEAQVQAAARRHLGSRVTSIEHFGSYSCRRLYGRADGGWSEHATADAFDVAAFRLADGRRVTVLGDWRRGDGRSAFLADVRDGACDLFATVLSPDYNAAHRDHLHLDQAARGAMGWRICR